MIVRRLAILIILGLVISQMSIRSQSRSNNKATPLAVSLSCDRASGRLDDSILLTVLVKNVDNKPIFVYGTLSWGPSASLFLLVENDKGESVPVTGFFEDALPRMPSHKDKSLFIKLHPNHLFGITRTDKLSNLVPKSGTYYFQIYYHGPVPNDFAPGKPAWGTDDPPILSNKIKIEVD